MPISRSGTYIYLDYEETVRFKLLDIGIEKSEKGITKRQLAIPHFVHISSTPFRGTNRKTMACGGQGRCELCQGGLNPSTLFRVKIKLVGEVWGTDEGLVKTYDMPKSGHDALAAEVQHLLMDNKMEDDVLATVFELRRLSRGKRPYFECKVFENAPVVAFTEDDLELNEEETELLTKLDAVMRKKDFKDSRQAMKNTLRKNYGWSDAKIEVAFATVLDENGFLRDDDEEKI